MPRRGEQAAPSDAADGAPGLVLAPSGRLALAVRFTIDGGLIRAYEVVADPDRLAALTVAVLRRPSR